MKAEGGREGEEGVEREAGLRKGRLFDWDVPHKSRVFEYLVSSWWLLGGDQEMWS